MLGVGATTQAQSLLWIREGEQSSTLASSEEDGVAALLTFTSLFSPRINVRWTSGTFHCLLPLIHTISPMFTECFDVVMVDMMKGYCEASGKLSQEL